MSERPYHPGTLPQLYVVAFCQLLGLRFGSLVICANKVDTPRDMVVRIKQIGSVFQHKITMR
jgi:hypothetical protein